jgi:hypothetical protein
MDATDLREIIFSPADVLLKVAGKNCADAPSAGPTGCAPLACARRRGKKAVAV